MFKKMLVLVVVFMSLFVSKANTADNFPQKENYMILVQKNEDKVAYADLAYLKSARFNVELVSLEDIGIDYRKSEKTVSDAIVEYLKQRNFYKERFPKETEKRIKFLLLDDLIYSGFISTAVGRTDKDIYLRSDYIYAFLWRDFYSRYIDLILQTFDFFCNPSIIVSRMNKDQLKYWNFNTRAKRNPTLHTVVANPIVAYRQEGKFSGGCDASVMHIDHSYYGNVVKDIFYNNKMSQITTLYETRYSKLPGSVLRKIKPINQPDQSLNKANFANNLRLSNMVLLGYTLERVKIADNLQTIAYRGDFVTSSWNDKNQNYLADEDSEIEIERIMKYGEMNQDNIKRFYFAPTGGYKINDPDFPISIRPKFDYHGEYEADPMLFYQEGWDPEGSNITTIWAGILREIANGKTFAEANLLGYANYVKYLKETSDPNHQAPNSLKLFCYGPPDETIYDLIQQPYLKADDVILESILDKKNIVIENLGDKDLKFKITGSSNNVSISQTLNQTMTVQPMQKFDIEFKRETPIGFLQNLKKFKFNTGWVYIESNDSFWKTKKIKISW